MAVIREVEFGDGTVVRIMDWGDYPLTSRAVFTSTQLATELSQKQYLFNYQVGGQMPMTQTSATIADTNMPGSGQLPMGHQMLVYSVQVIPDEFAWPVSNGQHFPLLITPERTWAAANNKWKKIFFQTYLQLVVEQTKAFVEGRLDYFPMGGGGMLSGGGGDASTDGAYMIHNGDRTWQATRRLAMPIHLGSLETFTVTLDWPRGGLDYDQANYAFLNGFGLQVRLTGPRQRPTS